MRNEFTAIKHIGNASLRMVAVLIFEQIIFWIKNQVYPIQNSLHVVML